MNLRKAIISGLVGSIGVAVLGLSFSFAWYGTSENLYIDTLVVRVSGTQELKISTSDELPTFKDSLKYKLGEDDNDLYGVGLFQPVSSMFKSNWLEDDLKTEPEFYVYNNVGMESDGKTPIYSKATFGFYSQHLYLYSSSTIVATLDPESIVVDPVEFYNNARVDQLMQDKDTRAKYEGYTDEEIRQDLLARLASITKCIRLGVYDIAENKFFSIDPYNNNGEILLGGRADLTDLSGRYYYDYFSYSGDKYEILYGEVNDREKAIYQDAQAEDILPEGEYNSFNSRTRAGVRAFDLEASVENGLEIKTEDTLALNEVEDNLFINLKAGIPKEFVLSIYMEGWDPDCTNVHMGGSFNVDLQFKISEEVQ